jgi:hypothetical protein
MRDRVAQNDTLEARMNASRDELVTQDVREAEAWSQGGFDDDLGKRSYRESAVTDKPQKIWNFGAVATRESSIPPSPL